MIELYRPGLRTEALASLAAGIRDTVTGMHHEGESIAFVSCTIVPDDEYFVCVLQATSERLARRAFARAGITFDRLSPAISIER